MTTPAPVAGPDTPARPAVPRAGSSAAPTGAGVTGAASAAAGAGRATLPGREAPRRRSDASELVPAAPAAPAALAPPVLAVLAHDLKDPLHVVLAAADLLLAADLPADDAHAVARRHVDMLLRAARRMQGLVDYLLDGARADAATIPVRMRACGALGRAVVPA